MEEDYRHPMMLLASGHQIELDVYVEALKLAFEYQGEQHYRAINPYASGLKSQQTRDEEKRVACLKVMRNLELTIIA